MIHINLQDPKTLAINRAVAAAANAIRARSFSGRHPDLGKMIKCQVCQTRHRASIKCEPKYRTVRYDLVGGGMEDVTLIANQNTVKGVIGAASFARKRILPHHSHRLLQLVERTQKLFPLNAPYYAIPEDCMKACKKEAARQLRKERAVRRKSHREMQEISRRINLGVLADGSRFEPMTTERIAVANKARANAKKKREAQNEQF